MMRLIFMILLGVTAGMAYGKLATMYHWYLPPNWLADSFGISYVETRIDLAYISLYVDAALAGGGLWLMLRLIRGRIGGT
jgi:hypothetical protein